MIYSWFEKTINHIGTETRLKLFSGSAVRNFGQWAKAWSSNILLEDEGS